ncbi:FAR1-related sequence 7 [Striga asiatica]|uniref:Protein FAR1-RELATED SEQUENCE n=1 Tax=Striga asiatica TaxID=4170 RepID=A0A5A7PUW1_STRAF|nr:FAR1-related sequence 7 [Striga asiatica]
MSCYDQPNNDMLSPKNNPVNEDYGCVDWDNLEIQSDDFFSCSCMMFESKGFICSHILRVFKFFDILELPDKYILSRWERKTRRFDHSKSKDIESYIGNLKGLKMKEGKRRTKRMKPLHEVRKKKTKKFNVQVEEIKSNGHKFTAESTV